MISYIKYLINWFEVNYMSKYTYKYAYNRFESPWAFYKRSRRDTQFKLEAYKNMNIKLARYVAGDDSYDRRYEAHFNRLANKINHHKTYKLRPFNQY